MDKQPPNLTAGLIGLGMICATIVAVVYLVTR